MAQLKAVIDSSAKTIQFSGPGTFQAKETIKSLGVAKWQPNDKSWLLVETEIKEEELHSHFKELTVEHSSSKPSAKKTETKPIDGVPEGLGVVALMSRVKSALSSAFPGTLFVKGVINKINESRHMYVELRDIDDGATHIGCFIWQNEIAAIISAVEEAGFALEPELEVMFEVSVGLNPRRGDISLTIKRVVVEYVVGKLAAERDKTNEKLKKEGLFDKNRNLKLPFLPRKLGIITSSGGTVINDFKNSLDVSEFGFELYWAKVQVQGAEATKNIRSALKSLIKLGDLDAILIFRGGGSKSELSVFNDYELAKAICKSPVPIVSAIGHQEDQSSAQDVSCISLGVPKDIGRYFADIIIDIRQRFADSVENIEYYSDQFLADKENKILHLGQMLSAFAQSLLEREWLVVTKLFERNLDKALNRQQTALEKIKFFEVFNRSHHPDNQLKLGYSIVREAKSRKIFSSGSNIKAGEKISIEFHDTEKTALIE